MELPKENIMVKILKFTLPPVIGVISTGLLIFSQIYEESENTNIMTNSTTLANKEETKVKVYQIANIAYIVLGALVGIQAKLTDSERGKLKDVGKKLIEENASLSERLSAISNNSRNNEYFDNLPSSVVVSEDSTPPIEEPEAHQRQFSVYPY